MTQQPTNGPILAPTLHTIEDLFWKVEREMYRTLRARDAYHKIDHFYNFCITAHALRDYFLKQAPEAPFDTQDMDRMHRTWSAVEVVRAVSNIANSAKHWTLTSPSRMGGVQLARSRNVDIYLTDDDQLLKVPVDVPNWVIEMESGQQYDTWTFMEDVLSYWRDFLKSNGIAVAQQSQEMLIGADQTRHIADVGSRTTEEMEQINKGTTHG